MLLQCVGMVIECFFFFLPEGKSHTCMNTCTQLSQKDHMKEVLTDATIFFVSSIFC